MRFILCMFLHLNLFLAWAGHAEMKDPAFEKFPELFTEYQAILALPIYQATPFAEKIESYRKKLPLSSVKNLQGIATQENQEDFMRMVVKIYHQSSLKYPKSHEEIPADERKSLF